MEVEKAVIGCALTYPNGALAKVLSTLKKDDFQTHYCRQIYSSIQNRFNEGRDCSPPSVAEDVEFMYVKECVDSACMEHQLDEMIKEVKEASVSRQFTVLAKHYYDKSKNNKGSALISEFMEKCYELINDGNPSYEMNREVLRKVIDNLNERERNEGLRGIPTGFTDLDRLIAGWQKGHLIFLGAVPKMGKSAMALEFALNAAEQGKSVLFFSLEMSPEELGDRQVANRGEVDSNLLRTGNINEKWKKVADSIVRLNTLKIGWVSRIGLTVTQIKAICRRFQQEHDLDLVIIDQLDKIENNRERNESLTQAIGRVTASLKKLAQEVEVPVICLLQLLDKVVSKRDIPRPQYGDERDSSAPAQDADVLMYLWRPEFYWPGKYQNMAELIVARQRAGPTGSVWLTWKPAFVSFRAMPRDMWPEEVNKNGTGA